MTKTKKTTKPAAKSASQINQELATKLGRSLRKHVAKEKLVGTMRVPGLGNIELIENEKPAAKTPASDAIKSVVYASDGQTVLTPAPKAKKGAKTPAKSAKKPASAPAKGKTAKDASKTKGAPKGKKAAKTNGVPRAFSKTAIIAELIGRKGGATAKELQDATGWQPHSVRGFLSTYGKTHTVASAKNDAGERVYAEAK